MALSCALFKDHLMASTTKTQITWRQDKGFTRDLGWVRSKTGSITQKRFLLGRDKSKAELANKKLEMLWAIVQTQTPDMEYTDDGDPDYDGEMLPSKRLWTRQGLWLAEAVRAGRTVLHLPRDQDAFDPGHNMFPDMYASHIFELQERYGSIMHFAPDDVARFKKGQEDLHRPAMSHLDEYRRIMTIAGHQTTADPTGQFLHDAIEVYATHCEANKHGGANEPKDARSLMTSIANMPLELFNYDAMQRLGDYWRARPISKRPGAKGAPLAINTVDNRLKTARRFVRWLHRSNTWSWRLPDDWESTFAFKAAKLRTEVETLATADGPATWTVEELKVLYDTSTDLERCLLLFGLNLGFAQSECLSFRKEDVKRDLEPPHISRVRRKTHKLFKVALWPETLAAIDWLSAHHHDCEPAGNPWVLLTKTGKRPTNQSISNLWNRLLNRVEATHSTFRRLPFKYLRKTAYQLVLEASGSHEVAGTFEGRGQLSSDIHADAYGRRMFDTVFIANLKVYERLKPVFTAVKTGSRSPIATS